jgi:phage host-nuclease inhibitor protein Gam
MARNSRLKGKAATYVIPQNVAEATEAVAEIGRRQRELVRMEAALGDAVAKVKERFEAQALPHHAVLKDLKAGVQAWAEANRAALTDGNKTKTVALASGEVKWRMDPPSVTIKGAELVLEALKRLGLNRFIRVKETISKEAILADPEAVKGIAGITVDQHENIVIEPFETELGEVR